MTTLSRFIIDSIDKIFLCVIKSLQHFLKECMNWPNASGGVLLLIRKHHSEIIALCVVHQLLDACPTLIQSWEWTEHSNVFTRIVLQSSAICFTNFQAEYEYSMFQNV